MGSRSSAGARRASRGGRAPGLVTDDDLPAGLLDDPETVLDLLEGQPQPHQVAFDRLVRHHVRSLLRRRVVRRGLRVRDAEGRALPGQTRLGEPRGSVKPRPSVRCAGRPAPTIGDFDRPPTNCYSTSARLPRRPSPDLTVLCADRSRRNTNPMKRSSLRIALLLASLPLADDAPELRKGPAGPAARRRGERPRRVRAADSPGCRQGAPPRGGGPRGRGSRETRDGCPPGVRSRHQPVPRPSAPRGRAVHPLRRSGLSEVHARYVEVPLDSAAQGPARSAPP